MNEGRAVLIIGAWDALSDQPLAPLERADLAVEIVRTGKATQASIKGWFKAQGHTPPSGPRLRTLLAALNKAAK